MDTYIVNSLLHSHDFPKYSTNIIKIKSYALVIVFLFVFLLSVVPVKRALAEPPRPSCDEGSIGGCISELLDQQDNLIDDVESVLDAIEQAGSFSPGLIYAGKTVQQQIEIQEDYRRTIENLRNENKRAREANSTTTDIEYDEMIAQGDKDKGGAKCKFSDTNFYNSLEDEGYLPPDISWAGAKFGNGKCDIFQAQDLDGNDIKVNERKENMCEKLCTTKVGQEGKSKERLIGSLQETITTNNIARQSLAQQTTHLAELGGSLSLQTTEANYLKALAVDPDACIAGGLPTDPGEDLEYIRDHLRLVSILDGVIIATEVVAHSSKAIHDTGVKVCDQTVAGFNTSLACVPFATVYHIAKIASNTVKGVRSLSVNAKNNWLNDYEIRQETQQRDKAKDCRNLIKYDTENLIRDVADLKLQAGGTNDALVLIMNELAKLKNLVEDNRSLLLTPHGQRKGFPSK